MKGFKDIPVLVTGAEGFIGSHLTHRLLREGARVSALVNPKASLFRLNGIKEKIKVYPLDIRDGTGLSKIVAEVKPQKIFHLAAVTDVDRSWRNLDLNLSVNLGGTLNLLQALSQLEYEILVCTCTAEAYGKNPAPFREDMPLDPLSPYSISKAAATMLCQMSWRSFGASVIILRLFLIYGPGQGQERFLPQLIQAGLSGQPFRMTAGEQTREYTYVDDILEGFLLAAQNEKAKGEVFNLGSGEEISLRDLVKKAGNLMKETIVIDPHILPYRNNEIWRFVGEHSKAKRKLGWEAVIDLDAGLRKTIEWYKSSNSVE